MDLSAKNITDYDGPFGRFQSLVTNSPLGRSSVAFVAESIFNAAIDKEDRLRYLVGQDAEYFFSQRQSAGVQKFMSGIKAQLLSSESANTTL